VVFNKYSFNLQAQLTHSPPVSFRICKPILVIQDSLRGATGAHEAAAERGRLPSSSAGEHALGLALPEVHLAAPAPMAAGPPVGRGTEPRVTASAVREVSSPSEVRSAPAVAFDEERGGRLVTGHTGTPLRVAVCSLRLLAREVRCQSGRRR
jgi:hypothetical protein